MILAWLGFISLGGVAFLTIRWLFNRVDSLDRIRPFPSVAVGALIVIAVAALTPYFLRLRLEARLEEAASAIVGVPVEVHCQAFGEAFVDAGFELGYVRFGPDGVPERKTLIKRAPCRELSDYVAGGQTDFTHEQAVAVHTLTHEAIHMTGITNEAETECLAIQRDAEMAQLLGAAPADAQRLARFYLENVYPRMPEGYRSDDCRNGGSLDANLPLAPWD